MEPKVDLINDAIPSEIFLDIFKYLSTHQMAKVRRVHKSWGETIDDHPPLWRILKLPRLDLGTTIRAIKEFDERSKSTLRWVEINTWNETPSSELLNHLKRSSASLLVLVQRGDSRLLGYRILESCPYLVIARLEQPNPLVPGPLRVLSLRSLKSLPNFSNRNPSDVFQNFTSLEIQRYQSHSRWRTLLEPALKTLRNLGIFIYTDKPDVLDDLLFPRWEILQLNIVGLAPTWLKAPPTIKLFMWWSSDTEIPDGIPSASELSVCGGDGLVSIISSLPHLETLRCIEIEHFTDPVKYIVHCLTKRRRGVKAGREVDGVKI